VASVASGQRPEGIPAQGNALGPVRGIVLQAEGLLHNDESGVLENL
jgi:hypothetical protein